MRNILLPTDFTASSLDFISQVAQALPGRTNFILFHAFDMPQSLADAMRRTGMRNFGNMVTEELRMKCKKIKGEHKNVNNISYKLMYGTTTMAFDNYAEANDVDAILVPPGYQFVPVVRDSVNPKRMFLKSGLPVAGSIEELKRMHNSTVAASREDVYTPGNFKGMPAGSALSD